MTMTRLSGKQVDSQYLVKNNGLARMIFRECATIGTLAKFGQRNINNNEVDTIKAEEMVTPTMPLAAAICVSPHLIVEQVRA